MFKLKSIVVLLSIALLASCGGRTISSTQNNLDYQYAKALNNFNGKNLEQAKQNFKDIVNQYPFRPEAIEAQVLLIWINYIQGNYVDVDVDLEAFLRFYVYNSYTPWARYMQGLVNYQTVEIASRDQTSTNQALNIFIEIARNANNYFAKDSMLRIDVLKHLLAQRSMQIASWYTKDKRYIAALNRYNEVIKFFSDTAYIQEALYKSAELWVLMGVNQEAFKNIAVLGYNYPNSKWYNYGTKLITKYTPYNYDTALKE